MSSGRAPSGQPQAGLTLPELAPSGRTQAPWELVSPERALILRAPPGWSQPAGLERLEPSGPA